MPTTEEIIWHDAQLRGIHVLAQNDFSYQLMIDASIYDTPAAVKRTDATIRLIGVQSLAINCDFTELAENLDAGNISNGYVVRRNTHEVLRLCLSDGYIEIAYESSKITRKEMAGEVAPVKPRRPFSGKPIG